VSAARALVVGAGISGAACAAALRSAGVAVTVRERARAAGGRLASPLLHGRRVDLGAAYLTVRDDAFAPVVDEWQRRGLVRAWTDTLEVLDRGGREARRGPVRLAAPGGLRTLARDLHTDVELGAPVEQVPDGYDAVVLAMPDPQAARLVPDLIEWVRYEPVIAIAAGFRRRTWALAAAFVNDDPDVALIADDGARRGDDAPVLVIHTTPERARHHLDQPDHAVEPALAATQRLLGVTDEPGWTHAHRWSFAKPAATHGDQPYALVDHIGVCGDSWCPAGAPRVEAAWLSGHRLGTALAQRLA
jgi:predicted NAD/FAD-dependent oxidoreductase